MPRYADGWRGSILTGMFDASTDPRRQFVALAAIALFDALLAHLEESEILGPDDQDHIIDDAIRFCRSGNEPMQIAAEFIEGAFGRAPASASAHAVEPLRGRWIG